MADEPSSIEVIDINAQHTIWHIIEEKNRVWIL